MKYAIFTDTTCDLTVNERKAYGIWPKMYEQHITYDGVDIDVHDPAAFYKKLEEGEYEPGRLKTSSAGGEAVAVVLDDIIEHTDHDVAIVYAGISPYMSAGSVQTVKMVMDQYAEDYPNRRFIYVDTQCISNGLGAYLQYLAKYAGDDIETYGRELGKHIVHLFTESDLRYSAKSGRYNLIQRIAMMTMSLAHLSPWMYFPSNDKLSMDGRIRKGNKILHEWVDYYLEHVADDNEFVRIGYGGAKAQERAERLVELLESRTNLSRDRIQLAYVSPIVGAHTGDTVLSFFFKQRDER